MMLLIRPWKWIPPLYLAGVLALNVGCSEPESLREPGVVGTDTEQVSAGAVPSNGSAVDPMQLPGAPGATDTTELLDSDFDGVPDEADSCAGTAAGVVVDARGCRPRLTEAQRFSLDVAFATGAAEVVALQGTQEILKLLQTYPETELRIEGHTDNQGPSPANQLLSERRAAAVAALLESQLGVDGTRINPVGFGEDRPIADNDTAAGRAANRRVDVVVVPHG